MGGKGSPDVYRGIHDVLAPQVAKVYREFARKYGWDDTGRFADDGRIPTPNEGMDDEMMKAANEALKASEWQMHHAHEQNTAPEAKLPLNITQKTDTQDSNSNVDSGD